MIHSPIRRTFLAATAAIGLSSLGAAAHAQPANTLRLVVPVPPGSSGDTYARYFADKLAPMLDQAVIVENRPGANTWIAVSAVLNSPADGKTVLLISPGSMSLLPMQNKEINYRPTQQLRPLMSYARNQAVLVTGRASNFTSLQQVVSAARAKPQSVQIGNYGLIYRLGAADLERQGNLQFAHVNYKGATQATVDVIGGHIDLVLMDLGGALELIRDGKLVPLATTGTKRSAALPDVPSVSESGFPGYNMFTWTGWGVRKETPEPAAVRLEQAFHAITASAEFKAFAAASGNPEITNHDRKQLEEAIHAETERYRSLMPSIEGK